ncbi:hypothetical protein AB0M46_36500 [Dactylosporangium sp. NPDC051485]|uniref:hypothetical protein n=1 Tax=Dactylosporangium sp. NPDC051485 TaxID=3154846 RepID=UPI00341F418D
MTVQMNDCYASALRAALIEHVEATSARRRRTGLRVVAGVGAAVLVLGGGVAAADAGWLSLPGGDVVATEAPTVTVTRTGSATVELGAAPKGTTDVMLKLTCLTAGTFTFEDGASLVCSPADARAGNVTTYKLALAPGQHSTSITTADGARWTLSATYAHVAVSEWGKNADGLTYGVVNERGAPDLVAVIATNGRRGYAYNRDLNPPGPTTLQTGTEPPRTVPVYTSDGHTRIGEFVIGGPAAGPSSPGG